VHPVKLQGGTTYTIDMEGKNNFDTLLRLEDANKKELANDDDGGKGLNSRIVFKAPEDGLYRIIATSFAPAAQGEYTLTVREGAAPTLIGQKAPEVVGDFAINGKAGKLSDLKGKVVLLDFWAVWCGPCIQTFPHLRAWHKEYADQGLEVLGVTTYYQQFGFDKKTGKLTRAPKLEVPAERDMIRDFAEHHNLSHRLMLVPREGWTKATTDYEVEGIPTVALIDRQGVIRMVRVGSSPENAEALTNEIKKLLAEK
jgi:thiol-disulfide isomerase/thioredoxin